MGNYQVYKTAAQDPNYLATVAMDACEVIILDVRVPCTPVARLNNHRACVNGIAWAPHSSCHICTAGESERSWVGLRTWAPMCLSSLKIPFSGFLQYALAYKFTTT